MHVRWANEYGQIPSAGTTSGTRRDVPGRAGTAEHFAPSAGCPRGSRPNPSAAFFATVRIFPGGSCLGPGARSFPSRWSRSQPRPGPRRRSISRGHIRSAFSRQGPTRRGAEGTSRAADRVCGPPPSGAPSGGSSVRFGLPATPAVTATPGDGEVTLTWSLPEQGHLDHFNVAIFDCQYRVLEVAGGGKSGRRGERRGEQDTTNAAVGVRRSEGVGIRLGAPGAGNAARA